MSISAHMAMTQDLLTVGPEETVSDVARKMVERKVSAVPVVDDAGILLGMLSEGDLMRHYGADHQRRRAWFLDKLAEGQKLSQDFLASIRLDMLHAKDLMVSPVHSAPSDTSLSVIVDLMLMHKVKRIAIVDNGKLVGLVSRADLLKRIIHNPDDVLDYMVNPN